jgi:hypothetical protein
MGEIVSYAVPEPPKNGACVGQEVEKWFPKLNPYENSREELRIGRINMKEALRICSSCDVKEACLNYALSWERHGIWGGTTEAEREALRRRNNIRFLRPSIQELGLGLNNASAH